LDGALWKCQLRAALDRIADENYQRLAWFNRHFESSSPDELICQLYDDHLFEAFIESDSMGLSSDQKREARQFSELMTKFCEATPSNLDARLVINDPRWERIRDEAKRLLLVLFSGNAR
jgi:hypothetical protein